MPGLGSERIWDLTWRCIPILAGVTLTLAPIPHLGAFIARNPIPAACAVDCHWAWTPDAPTVDYTLGVDARDIPVIVLRAAPVAISEPPWLGVAWIAALVGLMVFTRARA